LKEVNDSDIWLTEGKRLLAFYPGDTQAFPLSKSLGKEESSFHLCTKVVFFFLILTSKPSLYR
jgi:hypothetical protein